LLTSFFEPEDEELELDSELEYEDVIESEIEQPSKRRPQNITMKTKCKP
jgi:hypothetical protein